MTRNVRALELECCASEIITSNAKSSECFNQCCTSAFSFPILAGLSSESYEYGPDERNLFVDHKYPRRKWTFDPYNFLSQKTMR